MSDAALHGDIFLRESTGDSGNVWFMVEWLKRPCERVKPSSYRTRLEKLENFVKLCSSLSVDRRDGTIYCLSQDGDIMGKLSIRLEGPQTLRLSGKYIYNGVPEHVHETVSIRQYLSIADNLVLPLVVVVDKPTAVCTQEERLIFPVTMGKPRFVELFNNGDFGVRDTIQTELLYLPWPMAVHPFPPPTVKEGLEALKNVYSQFAEWAKAKPFLARILHGLWGSLAVYGRWKRVKIPYLYGPRGTGKSTILDQVYEMSSEVSVKLDNASGAAIRDHLYDRNVLADDVDETFTTTNDVDKNLHEVINVAYNRSTTSRMNVQQMKRVDFRIFGFPVFAGAEPGDKIRNFGIRRKLLPIPLREYVGYFRFIVDSDAFHMAMPLIGLADNVNGYTHKILNENPVDSVNELLERFIPNTPPQYITIKVDNAFEGEPNLEILFGIYQRLVKLARATDTVLNKHIIRWTNRITGETECYVGILAMRIPRIVHPMSERVDITVTQYLGAERHRSVSQTVHKEFYDTTKVKLAVDSFLSYLGFVVRSFGMRNSYIAFKVPCDADIVTIQNIILERASEVKNVIKNLMGERGKELDFFRAD